MAMAAFAFLLAGGMLGIALLNRQRISTSRHEATSESDQDYAKPLMAIQGPSIVSWNVYSSTGKSDKIATRLSQLSASIYCLSNVVPKDFAVYESAINKGHLGDFKSIDGSTGRERRLQIIYNRSRLKLLESYELSNAPLFLRHNYALPLVAAFVDHETGQRMSVICAQLAEAEGALRQKQAAFLRERAEEVAGPAHQICGNERTKSSRLRQFQCRACRAGGSVGIGVYSGDQHGSWHGSFGGGICERLGYQFC